jgi:lipopolysaccharide transport system ATP-binding protein
MSNAISIEHVSKAYRLGSLGGGTLGADLSRWWARVRHKPDPLLKIGEDAERKIGQQFWALKDVSFDVAESEVIGIIGRNGAGKSTLLKILSQVTAPTSGLMKIRGRIASLLEVGTGFHPDLTGRENVFLNGAILGMTKAEIRRKFDEIVAFSECEEFIDTPVKRYSSGMTVRLAFAVAAHLEPEILIVDEVLAVGDAQFQNKCLGKMRDVSRNGRTILFVSHSMQAVLALCTRAVLLHDGRVKMDGEIARVVAEYNAERSRTERGTVRLADLKREGTGKGRFIALSMTPVDCSGAPLEVPVTGCDLLVETEIECLSDFSSANACVVLHDTHGARVIDVNTALRGEFLSMKRGQRATVRFHLRDVLLRPGDYSVTLWLGRGRIEIIDHIADAVAWSIHQAPDASKHPVLFPGIYQCRFTHRLMVHTPGAARPDGEVSLAGDSRGDHMLEPALVGAAPAEPSFV